MLAFNLGMTSLLISKFPKTNSFNLFYKIKIKAFIMDLNKTINKDLILREKLALQRTTLANQSTFLSFLRTSMYFLVAGLSVRNLLQVENSLIIEIAFFIISFLIFVFGIYNFIKHKKSIIDNAKHIGAYQMEYYQV